MSRNTGPTRAVRLEVIGRDQGRCVVTGQYLVDSDTLTPVVQYSLQHRVARGMGGTKDPAVNLPVNLLLVSGTATTGAHGRIESDRAWARTMGFAVPSWRNPADVPVHHWLHSWSWLTPAGWVPLTQAELWSQANVWLADERRVRGVVDVESADWKTLAQSARDLFELQAVA